MKATCPRCKTTLDLTDDLAETRVQCPACSHMFRAPALPVEVPTPPPTPPPPTPPAPAPETEEQKLRRRYWKNEIAKRQDMLPGLTVWILFAAAAQLFIPQHGIGFVILLSVIAFQLRDVQYRLHNLDFRFRRTPPPS